MDASLKNEADEADEAGAPVENSIQPRSTVETSGPSPRFNAMLAFQKNTLFMYWP